MTPEQRAEEINDAMESILYPIHDRSRVRACAEAVIDSILADKNMVWMDDEFKRETHYEDEETQWYWRKVRECL